MVDTEPVIGLIESKIGILSPVRASLEGSGYKVVSGGHALDMLETDSLKLLILGLGQNLTNSQTLVSFVRESSLVPLIALGNSDDSSYAVSVLDAGADDYLIRGQTNESELAARVKASLRRSFWNDRPNWNDRPKLPDLSPGLFTNGDLSLDIDKHEVRKGDRILHLPKYEFDLLQYFMENIGVLLSFGKIVNRVWGLGESDYPARVNCRVRVGNLRSKIEEDPGNPQYIITKNKVGYKMVDHNEDKVDFDPTKL